MPIPDYVLELRAKIGHALLLRSDLRLDRARFEAYYTDVMFEDTCYTHPTSGLASWSKESSVVRGIRLEGGRDPT